MSSRNYSNTRKIDNIHQYIADKAARREALWSNGVYKYKGVIYTEEEFNAAFPAKIIYSAVQLDSTQVRTN